MKVPGKKANPEPAGSVPSAEINIPPAFPRIGLLLQGESQVGAHVVLIDTHSSGALNVRVALLVQLNVRICQFMMNFYF